MSKYRHTRTGAIREISGRVGFPWELIDEAGAHGSSSSTKPQLQARAAELGLDASGTKAELMERITAAESANG